MPVIKIFDLDGTVIDSYHRTKNALNDDGSFNLKKYLGKCNTPELIKQDQLLPLARYMQDLAAKGEFFVIITARSCSSADIAFLMNNKLVNHKTALMCRESVHDSIKALSDAEYKVHQLNRLKRTHLADQQFIMFDDNKSILDRLTLEANIEMIDAVALNQELNQYKQKQITPHLESSFKLLKHYAPRLNIRSLI